MAKFQHDFLTLAISALVSLDDVIVLIHYMKKITGANLEIGKREGVIPLKVTPQHFCGPLLSVFTHKEFRTLFK